jgi:hypothetical protein
MSIRAPAIGRGGHGEPWLTGPGHAGVISTVPFSHAVAEAGVVLGGELDRMTLPLDDPAGDPVGLGVLLEPTTGVEVPEGAPPPPGVVLVAPAEDDPAAAPECVAVDVQAEAATRTTAAAATDRRSRAKAFTEMRRLIPHCGSADGRMAWIPRGNP